MSQLEARSQALMDRIRGVTAEEAVLLLWALARCFAGNKRLIPLADVSNRISALMSPFMVDGAEPDPGRVWKSVVKTGWWTTDATGLGGLTGEVDRRLSENIWFRDGAEELLIERLGQPEIAAALLIEVGLRPMPRSEPVRRTSSADAGWDIAVGEVLLRRDLHKQYGGGWYGGMEPSARTPNVLLFTDPKIGEQFGYDHDGWHGDGTYRYTGEGTEGDQQFTHGNRATRDHVAEGRALRLFEIRGTSVAYMGEFVLDGRVPYHWDTSRDVNGKPRKVIVFHLRAV